MRVVFVSGNLSNGGAQRVISVVASSLAEKGHEVFLYLYSRSDQEYPISPKVKITSMQDDFRSYQEMSGISRITSLRSYLKKVNPDVAVGFLEGGYGLFLSSFGMKFKKVASARYNPRIVIAKKGLRRKLNKLWFAAADALVVQTNSQMDLITPQMRRHGVVIENPVSDYALESKCDTYREQCRSFVMAGRLETQKDYPTALRAMKIVKEKYPDIHLDIYGKGKEKESIEQEIKKLGLNNNVTLCGWSQNTIDEFRKHDLYLMTSDSEGMPNALMEAMAVGLPCISTDCETGPSDLISDGENGYLVEVGDAKGLAGRILDIIEMPLEERVKMANAAHATMRDSFNSVVISRKWEQLFYKLLNE